MGILRIIALLDKSLPFFCLAWIGKPPRCLRLVSTRRWVENSRHLNHPAIVARFSCLGKCGNSLMLRKFGNKLEMIRVVRVRLSERARDSHLHVRKLLLITIGSLRLSSTKIGLHASTSQLSKDTSAPFSNKYPNL